MKKVSNRFADEAEAAEKEGEEIQSKKREKKDGRLHVLRKWWPVPVYILMMIAVIFFIRSGDEDDLYEAHYKDGAETVTVGNTDYTVLSREDSDSYIGSFVSDKLNAVQKDKVASVRSYLLYVSVFFSVEGDENMDYLMDGKKTIYVKADMLDEAEAYFSDSSNISEYKMTAKLKDLDTMNTLSAEQIEMLFSLTGQETIVKDITVTENYETRREVYAFYDDGIFYKAAAELFLYEGEVYKTTMMIDGNDNEGVSVLRGIRLPEEYQEAFLDIWD